jgi:hypothetical protein
LADAIAHLHEHGVVHGGEHTHMYSIEVSLSHGD